MKKTLFVALTFVLLASPSGRAQDAKTAIDAAATALGTANLRTVQYSGWGYDYVFGQSYTGSGAWPRFNLPGFTMTIDFAAPAMRDDRRRTQLEDPPLGGGFQPMFGEQRLIAVVNGATRGMSWATMPSCPASATIASRTSRAGSTRSG